MVVDPNTMAGHAVELIELVGKMRDARTPESRGIYLRVIFCKLAMIEAEGYARCLGDQLKSQAR